MSKKILTELIHLNAPIAVGEITAYGESLKEIPWSTKPFPFHPYSVFERKNNVLYYLYEKEGMDWKIAQAGLFDENVIIEKFLESYGRVEKYILSEKALEREEFIAFWGLLKEFWTWFDGLWWIIEYRDKNDLDASRLMAARKHTEHFSPGLIAVLRNTFKHLVPRYADYADVLLAEEVISGVFPSQAVLDDRMKTCVYTDGRLYTSLEEVKFKYNLDVTEEINFDGTVLKGQVAFPGKVRGKVKIVKSRDDMKDFQKGDVIVSPTTTPDFMPVMQICSAIISEHGGIICHASITSRELKIPCVVGVKGATKVLKDGDMVEVDAEKGIVRIIT